LAREHVEHVRYTTETVAFHLFSSATRQGNFHRCNSSIAICHPSTIQMQIYEQILNYHRRSSIILLDQSIDFWQMSGDDAYENIAYVVASSGRRAVACRRSFTLLNK
jgi:hypothetical protein